MTNRSRTGIAFALAAAFISGISIYVNKAAVTAVGDPLLFTTLKNSLVGGIMLAYLVSFRGRLRPVKISPLTWPGLLGLALIGGSVPFLLFFEGLSLAAAPSAALVHKSLFIWVALLAVPLLGERPGAWTLAGLALLAAGQLLSGWPGVWGWGVGETLVLIATILWAGETILVKRLLPGTPTSIALAARMAGGSMVMWVYLFSSRPGFEFGLTGTGWLWVILTAVLLLGYVSAWYGALERSPATIVTGLLPLGAVITAGISLGAGGGSLSGLGGLGLAAMGIGGALLVRFGLSAAIRLRPGAGAAG
jgi:drug/metabolite transporter (DMT)-like permease